MLLGRDNNRRPAVLVVDDDPAIQELVECVLEDEYTVHTVGDGMAALAMARRDPPDVMLLDLMLPGMDGFSVAQEIRRDAELQDIPILVISAHPALRQRALEMGLTGFISKPFEPDDLLEQVSALTHRARL